MNTPPSPPPPPFLRTSHRRGGQPGNQNARKSGTFSRLRPGPFNPIQLHLETLRSALKNRTATPKYVLEQARSIQETLCQSQFNRPFELLGTSRMVIQTISLSRQANARVYHARCRSQELKKLALSPIGVFLEGCREAGITRDADSFFPSSLKSAQYSLFPSGDEQRVRIFSPLPPSHPDLPTNLTESQWDILTPLIPPDPYLDWLTGRPPILIAANRWGFTNYFYTGEFQDFEIMEKYNEIHQRCPDFSDSPLPPVRISVRAEGQGLRKPDGLDFPSSPVLPSLSKPPDGANPVSSPKGKDLGRGRGRGRPRTSPRALLDGIIWKLATGHPWASLPSGFPPYRLCQRYYRRLFRSGRWYTLVLALYNHFRTESSIDLSTLVEDTIFRTTSSQKITIKQGIPLNWQNCTALFFMQLARTARTRLNWVYKQSHPGYSLQPVFKGNCPITTGLPHGIPLPPPRPKPIKKTPLRPSQEPPEDFQPIENSPAWKKWLKIEQDRQILASELSRRLNLVNSLTPDHLTSQLPDYSTDQPPNE